MSEPKRCPHCGLFKSLEEFPLNRTNGYRYRSCQTCRRKRDNHNQRERYRNDPDYRKHKRAASLKSYRKDRP